MKMKRMWCWRNITPSLLFALVTNGIAAEPLKDLEKVRVGLPAKAIDFSPYYVGARVGIYQKEGLQPEFVFVKSPLHLPALLSGELDYSSSFTGAITGGVAGMPVRGILALMVKNIFFLVSQPDIKDVKQLKGKRIGVTALAAGSSKIAEDALKNLGIDPGRDVIFVATGPDIRLAALKARSVDAAVMWPPDNFLAERQGFHNLMWLGDATNVPFVNGLIATTKKIKEQPDQVYRMLRATVRSMALVRERKQELLPILMKEFKGWDQEVLDRSLNFVVKGMSDDGMISESQMRYLVSGERTLRGIKSDIPLTQVADFEPLRRVLRELKAE
jgi:NitT/TauT family transport system substrate-binding protein